MIHEKQLEYLNSFRPYDIMQDRESRVRACKFETMDGQNY